MAELPTIRSFHPGSLQTTIMFFPLDILDPNTPELSDLLREALEGVFVETDRFFRLRINPSNLKVGKSKLTALTYTKLGFDRSIFGNALTMLDYSGTTGYLRPPSMAEVALDLVTIQDPALRNQEIARRILTGSMDITQSPVWQKFRRMERFLERMDNEVVMYFDFRLYTGMVTRFNYVEDANSPLQIQYTFSFEARTDAPTGPDRYGKELINLAVR